MTTVEKIYDLLNVNTVIEIVKIIFIYITLLLLFYLIHNNNKRLLIVSILCIISVLLFHIDLKKIIFILIIAISCVITESIYVNFFMNTWQYKHKNIINIPYWLIPLWFIAILFIIKLIKLYDKNINKVVDIVKSL